MTARFNLFNPDKCMHRRHAALFNKSPHRIPDRSVFRRYDDDNLNPKS
jgi:hypothetical protein